MLAAILRERNTIDVLHDEPGSSIVESVGVIKTGDQRVIQLSQSALLAGETFTASRREPGIPQDLDRDLRAEVDAFGQINHTHPTFA